MVRDGNGLLGDGALEMVREWNGGGKGWWRDGMGTEER